MYSSVEPTKFSQMQTAPPARLSKRYFTYSSGASSREYRALAAASLNGSWLRTDPPFTSKRFAPSHTHFFGSSPSEVLSGESSPTPSSQPLPLRISQKSLSK